MSMRDCRIWKILACFLFAVTLFLGSSAAVVLWGESLAAAMEKVPKTKNVIVMISDGCGYNQVRAADLYQYGKDRAQAYENFPFKYGVSTFDYEMVNGAYTLLGYDPARAWSDFNYVEANATDSAAAATAMSTGTKTYGGAIGVDINKNALKHITQYAEEKGMATGVVTSVEWSQATPAGFVAHNASRNNYGEIAQEMINGSATDVIMGCGNPWFDDNGQPLTTPNAYTYVGGKATWDALVAGTAGNGVDADHNGVLDDAWRLIQTSTEFQALMNGPTPKRVCGIPQVYATLQQARGGDGNAAPYVVPLNQNIPTLADMSRGALNVLDNDKDGFFLMIEGGAVDWACHANQSGRAIEEEIDFNRAVEAVTDWVRRNSNWGETLLMVTGDHETGHLCGPGSALARKMLPLVNNGAGRLPGMEWNSGGHTNSLVPLYAQGMGAIPLYFYADQYDRVRGRYVDNTEIAKVIIGLSK